MPDRPPLILVCDDTPAKRYVLSSWLRRSGYRVLETDTASEALQILRSRQIDLAVLDVHLPDGSGLDVTRTVRADPDRGATPIVHVSAVARETLDKVAGLDGGADAYLVDPIDPEELLSTIRALLRSSGARRDAEELARRASRLNRAAVRVNLATTVPRLCGAIARAAAEVLARPAVAVLVNGREAVRAGGAAVTAAPLDDGLVATLAALGDGPVLVEDVAAEPWSAVLPHGGGQAWWVWGLAVAGAAAGLLAVPTSPTAANDEFLLERLVQLAAVALENVRTLEREHRTALILQRSLLPVALPQPKGLKMAARYRASELHAEVGGDFFDAFEVDRTCFLVIGDVQGHSLEAAVVMAELRYSLRAYAYDGYSTAEVVDRLDGVLVRNEPDLIATACVLALAPDRTRMEIVSAGHVPVLRCRGGVVTQLDVGGVLLGLGRSHQATTVDLQPGDRLLLMTDGLVERRHEPLDDTLGRLADTFAGLGDLTSEQAADRVLADYGATEDDVALLVVDVVSD